MGIPTVDQAMWLSQQRCFLALIVFFVGYVILFMLLLLEDTSDA